MLEYGEAAHEIASACRPIALTALVDCTAYLPKRSIFTSAVGGIFVCDMPGRNRIMRPIITSADLSQLWVNADGKLHKKMAPEVRGHR